MGPRYTHTHNITTMLICTFFWALRIPVAWRKAACGTRIDWLGMDIDAHNRTLRPQERVIPMLKAALQHIMAGKPRPTQDRRRQIQRIAWYIGAHNTARAHMAPLYALLDTNRQMVTPSADAVLSARILSHLVDTPCPTYLPAAKPPSGQGSTDEAASDTTATVGSHDGHSVPGPESLP